MIISAADRDAVPAVFLDVYGHPSFLSLRLALMIYFWRILLPQRRLGMIHRLLRYCRRTHMPFAAPRHGPVTFPHGLQAPNPARMSRHQKTRAGVSLRGYHPKAKVGTRHLGFPSLLSLDQTAISQLSSQRHQSAQQASINLEFRA
jgi:hypothetical protein